MSSGSCLSWDKCKSLPVMQSQALEARKVCLRHCLTRHTALTFSQGWGLSHCRYPWNSYFVWLPPSSSQDHPCRGTYFNNLDTTPVSAFRAFIWQHHITACFSGAQYLSWVLNAKQRSQLLRTAKAWQGPTKTRLYLSLTNHLWIQEHHCWPLPRGPPAKRLKMGSILPMAPPSLASTMPTWQNPFLYFCLVVSPSQPSTSRETLTTARWLSDLWQPYLMLLAHAKNFISSDTRRSNICLCWLGHWAFSIYLLCVCSRCKMECFKLCPDLSPVLKMTTLSTLAFSASFSHPLQTSAK